jgi:hypothetical protein
MDPKSDLLQVALEWLGTRGLLGLFLAAFTTVLRALLGFDETRRQQALSFTAALFVIGFVAPGVSELLALRPEGSSMIGAILGLTARPLLESLMHLASSLRQDALAILRSWISRPWD